MDKTNKQTKTRLNAKGLMRVTEREKKLAAALRKNLRRRRDKNLSSSLNKNSTAS